MKVSSAFKVGILTLTALIILVSTLMWIKGRSISKGERYTIQFKDINGIRVGSNVQMMGLRVGQIEEITPVLNVEDNHVEIKFVITEPNIKIPRASVISIQQSGIIGEQFLEICPPKETTIYVPLTDKSIEPKNGDKVRMKLDKKVENVGLIKSVSIVETASLKRPLRSSIKTKYSYKINYIIDLPGLVPPILLNGYISKKDGEVRLLLKPFNGMPVAKPSEKLEYTVVEPMRLVDFMKLQYQSASSLNETNERIAAILTDEVIADLKSSAKKLDELVEKSGQAIDKAEVLIESSKQDLHTITTSISNVADQVIILTNNLNNIVGDKQFKKNLVKTTESVGTLSNNINKLLEDEKTAEIITNLNETLKNVSEISAYVNQFTKDDDIKVDLKDSIKKLNAALDEFKVTLAAINEVAVEDKDKIRETISETAETSKNLNKFSKKLNKRFLLFRLMF